VSIFLRPQPLQRQRDAKAISNTVALFADLIQGIIFMILNPYTGAGMASRFNLASGGALSYRSKLERSYGIIVSLA